MPPCEACGRSVDCAWKDCPFPHFCRSCRAKRPHWYDAEDNQAQESNIGLPIYAKHRKTGDIYYVKHHPKSQHSKIAMNEESYLRIANSTLINRFIPLPNFPDNEIEGYWVIKHREDIYERREESKREHQEMLGMLE